MKLRQRLGGSLRRCRLHVRCWSSVWVLLLMQRGCRHGCRGVLRGRLLGKVGGRSRRGVGWVLRLPRLLRRIRPGTTVRRLRLLLL